MCSVCSVSSAAGQRGGRDEGTAASARPALRHTADKGENLLVLLLRLRLLHKVNLVLEDDNVLQLHNLNGGKVLRRLRLGAGLVASWAWRVKEGTSPSGRGQWLARPLCCRRRVFWRSSSSPLLLPMRRSAASMTAAPLSMVAMRMSCPGQSTKDTCLRMCVCGRQGRACQRRNKSHHSTRCSGLGRCASGIARSAPFQLERAGAAGAGARRRVGVRASKGSVQGNAA